MPVLALDTSAAMTVAVLDGPAVLGRAVPDTAVSDAVTVLAERAVSDQRRHAELLAPLVAQVLAEAHVAPRDLDHVVVGTGPAPFTGLRAGLVTARTLAFGAGVPAYGAGTLDALAAQAANELAVVPGTRLVVATDARRREVYHRSYVVTPDGMKPVAGPQVGSPAQLAADGVLDGAVVVGAGAQMYRDLLAVRAADLPELDLVPDPGVLAALVGTRLARGERPDTRPLYLRRPDAQVPAARKRAS
ncbi:MAG: tRNA (adenosine(37)-N6)-threonylcarbamoyltransferase complex dimerization subunit type 1 TsaB [Cellulomonadaceae bacterium]